ncbi:MAG: hypothetical protein QM697_16825 [Lachnospiraceae bacterium]
MKKGLIILTELLILPVGLFLIFSMLAEGFGLHSIPIIISQSMIPVVTGFGLSLLMNADLMDFSMGARAVFAATIGGILAQQYGIAGLVAGCVIGALGGAFLMAGLYQILKIPAMVISLGIVLIYEVVAAKLAGSSGYIRISANQYSIGSYPYNIMIMLIAAIIFYILFYRTQIGCHITAVGNDEKMCKNVGVDAAKVKFLAIILTGVFCSFSALLMICYSGSVTASTDMGTMSLVFKPIMCVILARHLRKYFDCMPVLIGLGGLCLSIIFNGFIALGFDEALQDIVLGVFLVLVLGSSTILKEFKKLQLRRAV